MDALNIIEIDRRLHWQYDEEADVLYIATDAPQPALGMDIGEGVVVRYDEARGEVTGITIIGLRDKMARELEPLTTQENHPCNTDN